MFKPRLFFDVCHDISYFSKFQTSQKSLRKLERNLKGEVGGRGERGGTKICQNGSGHMTNHGSCRSSLILVSTVSAHTISPNTSDFTVVSRILLFCLSFCQGRLFEMI